MQNIFNFIAHFFIIPILRPISIKKKLYLYDSFPLRGLVDEVGTAIRQHNGYIYIPTFQSLV